MNLLQSRALAPVIERSVKHTGRVVEYACQLLNHEGKEIVLLHTMKQSFDVQLQDRTLHIPQGSRTFAYYWLNRPYNAYCWIGPQDQYLGTYYNLVKNTTYYAPVLAFHDLVLDVVVLPDDSYQLLDEHELPLPLADYEEGSVQRDLDQLLLSLNTITNDLKTRTSEWRQLLAAR